jgi:hypothetical protein
MSVPAFDSGPEYEAGLLHTRPHPAVNRLTPRIREAEV